MIKKKKIKRKILFGTNLRKRKRKKKKRNNRKKKKTNKLMMKIINLKSYNQSQKKMTKKKANQ